ncbi:MAG: hypothetical protein JWM91_2912 [Rhodospirillales bacterium]|nr:hypothetical protein [Rhodospirillales bacterium]
MAREAAASAGPLVDRLVAILDCQIGVMCRVVAESPHIAELEESRAFAAATYDKFDRDIEVLIKEVLSLDGVSGRNVPEMLTACAIGMVEICGTNEKLFRERLTALVDTLIQGLRSRMELTRETESPKHFRKTRQKPGATDLR